MDRELFEEAMRRLVGEQNNDKEGFFHDLELRAREINVDIDQEEKNLASLSDMYHEDELEIKIITNLLQQVNDVITKLYSAEDSLQNGLTDAKLQTAALVHHLEEKVRNLKQNFHQAPIFFGNENLNNNIGALSEEIAENDRQLSDGKRFDNDFDVTIKEVASSYPLCTWIPQLNDLTAECSEARETICAAEHEVFQLDEQLKKLMQ